MNQNQLHLESDIFQRVQDNTRLNIRGLNIRGRPPVAFFKGINQHQQISTIATHIQISTPPAADDVG